MSQKQIDTVIPYSGNVGNCIVEVLWKFHHQVAQNQTPVRQVHPDGEPCVHRLFIAVSSSRSCEDEVRSVGRFLNCLFGFLLHLLHFRYSCVRLFE